MIPTNSWILPQFYCAMVWTKTFPALQKTWFCCFVVWFSQISQYESILILYLSVSCERAWLFIRLQCVAAFPVSGQRAEVFSVRTEWKGDSCCSSWKLLCPRAMWDQSTVVTEGAGRESQWYFIDFLRPLTSFNWDSPRERRGTSDLIQWVLRTMREDARNQGNVM